MTQKDKQLNLRISDEDINLLKRLREKLPDKNDSEIIRTALKMLAIDLGC